VSLTSRCRLVFVIYCFIVRGITVWQLQEEFFFCRISCKNVQIFARRLITIVRLMILISDNFCTLKDITELGSGQYDHDRRFILLATLTLGGMHGIYLNTDVIFTSTNHLLASKFQKLSLRTDSKIITCDYSLFKFAQFTWVLTIRSTRYWLFASKIDFAIPAPNSFRVPKIWSLLSFLPCSNWGLKLHSAM